MVYSLLLLGHKPVQHVTVLNTVGNCNTGITIYIKKIYIYIYIYIFSLEIQPPLWVVFYSLLAGFSFLAYDVS